MTRGWWPSRRLRRLPELEILTLGGNPIGDEGLAALVAPPPQAGALPRLTGGLTKLKVLELSNTQVSDAGCATLLAALDNGALPGFKELHSVILLEGTPASAAAQAAVQEVVRISSAAARLRALLLLA